MKIVLDTNVYVADLRMRGVAFSNLFDFIRKTKSTVFLPRIVREEVVYQYAERFQKQVRETAKHWKALQNLVLDEEPEEFHAPELKYQIRELRKRLRTPAKEVAIKYHPDVSAVDVNEVAIRGIRRIPPANPNGEELRDVIIWYQVLNLAKGSDEPTAFVTQDQGFWDGDDPRPAIQKDAADCGGKVHLYKAIDDLIKANSPQRTELTEESASQLMKPSDFSDLITPKFLASLKKALRWPLTYDIFGAYGGEIRVHSLKLIESMFQNAIAYEVSADVRFVTATYEFLCNAEVELTLNAPSGPVLTTGFGALLQSQVQPQNPFLSSFSTVLQPYGPLANPLWPAVENKPTVRGSTHVKEIRAVGVASVSARLVNDKLAERDLDSFVLSEVEAGDKHFDISEVVGPRGSWLRPTLRK